MPVAKDKASWVFVTVPVEDAIGNAHHDLWLNKDCYKAGQAHLVPPDVAVTLNERLRVNAKAAVRVLQPRRDMEAVNAVGIGSVAGHGAMAVDPNTIPEMRG